MLELYGISHLVVKEDSETLNNLAIDLHKLAHKKRSRHGCGMSRSRTIKVPPGLSVEGTVGSQLRCSWWSMSSRMTKAFAGRLS